LVRNVWAVGEFWQSCSSIPNWCCCNLLLPVIPLYRYVTVSVFFLAAPLPTPEEPSQQFRMKLQIRRRL